MQKRFFASLFDLSFTSFITTRVIKVLYVITLVFLVVAYLVIAVSIFAGGDTTTTIDINGNVQESGGGNTAFGILWLLILGPILLFFYTLIYRVVFELISVFFRIFENTRDQLALDREVNPEAAARVAAAQHPAVFVSPPQPPAAPPAAPPAPPAPPAPGTGPTEIL